jgi:hypothetical protein
MMERESAKTIHLLSALDPSFEAWFSLIDYLSLGIEDGDQIDCLYVLRFLFRNVF